MVKATRDTDSIRRTIVKRCYEVVEQIFRALSKNFQKILPTYHLSKKFKNFRTNLREIFGKLHALYSKLHRFLSVLFIFVAYAGENISFFISHYSIVFKTKF